MISNRYNRIPHLTKDAKRESQAISKDGIKYKTVQEGRQEESSFLIDGHQFILRKANKKPKPNRKQMNNDNQNKPQQKHRLGTVSD